MTSAMNKSITTMGLQRTGPLSLSLLPPRTAVAYPEVLLPQRSTSEDVFARLQQLALV